jgi:hypothetical protein
MAVIPVATGATGPPSGRPTAPTVQMPPQYGTFRQAPRVAAAEAQQGRLELE